MLSGQWQVRKRWRKQAFGFFGQTGRRLEAFRQQVKWLWLRALRRRSQRHCMTWMRLERLASRWLPQPRILHPWPDARFAVKHPR